jgi:hypothetical protein
MNIDIARIIYPPRNVQLLNGGHTTIGSMLAQQNSGVCRFSDHFLFLFGFFTIVMEGGVADKAGTNH